MENLANLRPLDEILGVKFWTFKRRMPGKFFIFRIIGVVDNRYVFQNIRDSQQFIYRAKDIFNNGDMQPALLDCVKLFGAQVKDDNKAVGE